VPHVALLAEVQGAQVMRQKHDYITASFIGAIGRQTQDCLQIARFPMGCTWLETMRWRSREGHRCRQPTPTVDA
jgi:hypothetical protein